MLDFILTKSIQCTYFHEISFGKVDDRRERGGPMITLKDMVLCGCWRDWLHMQYDVCIMTDYTPDARDNFLGGRS